MAKLIKLLSAFLAVLPMLDWHLLNVRAKPFAAPAFGYSRPDSVYG
jgi:hypothetical protein